MVSVLGQFIKVPCWGSLEDHAFSTTEQCKRQFFLQLCLCDYLLTPACIVDQTVNVSVMLHCECDQSLKITRTDKTQMNFSHFSQLSKQKQWQTLFCKTYSASKVRNIMLYLKSLCYILSTQDCFILYGAVKCELYTEVSLTLSNKQLYGIYV